MINVKHLFTYPVKSLAGISIENMQFDELGPKHDRRYMLIDEKGDMLTQRDHPTLALFKTKLTDEELIINHDTDNIYIPLNQQGESKVISQVWDDSIEGFEVNQAISQWFSQKLKFKVRLIKIDENHLRTMDRKYVNTNKRVGLADGFQILLTQQSSLEELKLGENEDMLRFRPNIVVEGGIAYSEDFWRKIKINKTILDIVKPCARCSMPAVNPIDGSKQAIVIRKLAQTRLFNKEMYFGQNAIITDQSMQPIKIGDSITIIKKSNSTNIT